MTNEEKFSQFDLYSACKGGNEKSVHFMIEKGIYDWSWGFYGACRYGHENIVHLMIKKGVYDWNWGFYGACQGGHENIVHLMIENGATEWNEGLSNACQGGHENIVRIMINKGANNLNDGLYFSCLHGHANTALMMLKYGATASLQIDYEIMIKILNLGQLNEGEIVRFFGSRGTEAINKRKVLLAEVSRCLRDRITYDVMKYVLFPMIGYTI
jgi:hypothetical protein